MNVELSQEQVDFVLTSLEYTRSAFRNASYPTYTMKQDRVKEVSDIMNVFRKAKKTNKEKS